MSGPEEIARKLTKPQKRAMLWLLENHDPKLAVSRRGWYPRWNVMNRLRLMGLVERWHCPRMPHFAYSLAVNGYAVRAALARLEGSSHD